VQLKNKIAYAT